MQSEFKQQRVRLSTIEPFKSSQQKPESEARQSGLLDQPMVSSFTAPVRIPELPPEIWRQILDIAVSDDPILQPRLISPLDECTWETTFYGDFRLRRPYENMLLAQRQGYATKKAFTLTCKLFAQLAAEYLYRSILVTPRGIKSLAEAFDRNSGLGWWTKALCIRTNIVHHQRDVNFLNLYHCVVTVLRHCPNLQVCIIDPQIGGAVAFSAIADALRTFCSQSIKLAQWTMAFNAQSKLGPALYGLRNIEAVQIDLNYPPLSDTSATLAGGAKKRLMTFPQLRQLTLRGAIGDFIEHIEDWEMPELTELTLDFKSVQNDLPELNEIVAPFAHQLQLLDVNALHKFFDVPQLLAQCPNLITFCFNLDWALEGSLIERPHGKIENVGLHGLKHAFGVGYAGAAAAVNPFDAIVMRRRNDINFNAISKFYFPQLKLVRVLEMGVLEDLNKNNGPAVGVCYERWERWWEQCALMRVRLEDCTGAPLGTLPQNEEEFDEDESEFTGSVIDESLR